MMKAGQGPRSMEYDDTVHIMWSKTSLCYQGRQRAPLFPKTAAFDVISSTPLLPSGFCAEDPSM